jgi:hypothetical protein
MDPILRFAPYVAFAMIAYMMFATNWGVLR